MTTGRPRLAVTGIGMVTGLGLDTETTLLHLLHGKTALSTSVGVYNRCSVAPIVAEVPLGAGDCGREQGSDGLDGAMSDRYAELAAREALSRAGLSAMPIELVLGASTAATREGVAESASRGDQSVLPLVSRLVSQPIGASGHRLAALLGTVRSSTVVCSACSSGALAIAVGAMRLEQGSRLPQLVGGCDSLNLITLSGFESLGALSKEPCRPFDSAHCGLNLGEGAGFLVLETEEMVGQRRGNVLVWLDGYAVGAEAHHLTHPEPEGARAAALVTQAMQRARLRPEDVGYVNAHGTATVANDEMETRVLKLAFGEHLGQLWVSSSKGQIGHTLAAAGAIEAAITARAIVEQAVPPTCGLSQPAEACQLRHVKDKAAPAALRAALSNSFGFGGACAVLAMRHRDAQPRSDALVPSLEVSEPSGGLPNEAIFVTGLLTLGVAGILHGTDNAAWLDSDSGNRRADLPFSPLDLLVMERSRRFDRLAALTALGCSYLTEDAGLADHPGVDALPADDSSNGLKEPVGLVLGNALGSVGRSAEFVQRILKRGARGANPAEFPHLLPSAVTGNASIYARLRGPTFNVSDMGSTIQSAIDLGINCIRGGLARAMLAGTTECRDDAIVDAQQQGAALGSYPADANDGSAWLLLEGQSAARERGATGCELATAGWLGELLAASRRPPSPASDSLVLWALDQEAAAEEVLSCLGWTGTAIRSCMPQPYDGWSQPGFVLAAGAALVCSGACSSSLVVTPSPRGIHCAVFRRTPLLAPKLELGRLTAH